MKAPSTEYKSVVITGNTYTIRPVREDDFDFNLIHTQSIPDANENSVNFGAKPDTKKLNLWGIYDADDARSNAFVSVNVIDGNAVNSKLSGFALYARNRQLYSHEFYMSVDKSLADTSMPAELLSMIIRKAKSQGAKVLFCHADEHNEPMRKLADRAKMLVTLEPGKSHGIMYTLMLDKHPHLAESLVS